MPLAGWTLRSKRRQLELSLGGRWYLLFTLALGGAAVYSGNNVIYLLESLLLSALLVSGALSEATIARVRVGRETGNVHAGAAAEDVFVVENLGNFPLYCLELGEYSGARYELTGFLLMLPARATVRVRSRQTLPERGRHRWDGLGVGTSFPFGFARKVRYLPSPGSRRVWPAAAEAGPRRERQTRAERGEHELVAGEVSPVEPWGDASRVHWPISFRAGELLARPVRPTEAREELVLELRHPGPAMEREIRRATGALIRRQAFAPTLVLSSKGERRRIEGRARALDALALLPREAR
jgi:uncharacterized protein (DUF58 family)